ncbi:unnamed protein product [Acanthoscelides obtectus]|uniref:Uncharacterized protein n=1 Tax=Acanthoscelides obtectus TaxID=200917 RepID=A0A9P0KGZ4_ACAOB|nr:unnamed protein product [Acanthoscelides obtectus]CAK1629388.1 hypothetical protein AOBTE_LOCUS5714 [Acanthoscelides obtectus]
MPNIGVSLTSINIFLITPQSLNRLKSRPPGTGLTWSGSVEGFQGLFSQFGSGLEGIRVVSRVVTVFLRASVTCYVSEKRRDSGFW